ncbi:MAG: hypothetical protein Q9M92_06670 [Enterobacterales bacterium]|nr:hypothetical protein [Enterobacterales bacterium]
MKHLLRTAIACTFLYHFSATAALPRQEMTLGTSPLGQRMIEDIRSGSLCKNTVYKRFKLVEKTNHKRLRFLPSHELLVLATEKEIMCPWSLELDFNGDRRMDWIGFVKLDDDYLLLAYLSGPRDYKIEIVQQSKMPPKNFYLQWVQTRNLPNMTTKVLDTSHSRYALKLSRLNGSSDVYLWDGKKMKLIFSTQID